MALSLSENIVVSRIEMIECIDARKVTVIGHQVLLLLGGIFWRRRAIRN